MNPIPNPGSGTRNVLNSDVDVKGNLKFAGELTFAGHLEGEFHSEGALQLEDKAVVRGNVSVNTVVVRGKVSGNVSAKERIEIKSVGEVFGDIRASKLIIEEGATFVGKCDVNPNKTFPAHSTPPPPLPGGAPAPKPPEPVNPIKK
jgi:cytoskeletal protein CcmA (bactofilin family)